MLAAGDLLGGRYRVERLLGRGGMSNVYLASDVLTGHLWAVKELRSDCAAGEGIAHYVVKIYPTAIVDIAPGFTYRGAEFIATRSLIKESRINYRAKTSSYSSCIAKSTIFIIFMQESFITNMLRTQPI